MNQPYNYQELFKGFQDTPLLWSSDNILNIEQYSPKYVTEKYLAPIEFKKLRLGKWVEQFVIHQLKHDKQVKLLEENIQIASDKITIGELDVLFLLDKNPIHLEIIYKFYLYDDSISTYNPLDKWIGPNRSDTLVYKLQKLKEKQLPLLYHKETQSVLSRHNIQLNTVKQSVCFKAQLFLPFKQNYSDFDFINKACFCGWYISYNRINELRGFKFYILEKLEWLCLPKDTIDWLSFIEAKNEINVDIANKYSPLCWIKNEHDEIQKCFITWW